MELLAPAGSFDALVAAVQNGADAVYLGFGAFNARRSAGNFSDEEFARAVDYCHARNVKVHVTLNTLLKQDELDGYLKAAQTAAACGADAAIVQDWGGAQLIRRYCPGFHLHMSTQAACCNAAGVRFAMDMGYDRVVLARECSLDEIRKCVALGAEIEFFAHGALCVCFSGQCLFSSLVGGRSGNRGMCAQPCRLNYTMKGACEREGCLLSPRDIMMIDRLPELKAAGVCSLKLEGRLKRPEYVAEVTRAYRHALDSLEEHPERYAPDAGDVGALKQIFNRGGFSNAYLDTPFVDSAITDINRPNHMGVKVGTVADAKSGKLSLLLDTSLDAGDQISLRQNKNETGFELKQALAKGSVRLNVPELRLPEFPLRGAEVYRAAASAQLTRAKESTEGEHRAVPVTLHAELHEGQPSALTVSTAAAAGQPDIEKLSVTVYGEAPQHAMKAPLTYDAVTARLSKLGGTALSAENVTVALDESLFMTASQLNELRRKAVEAYSEKLLALRRGCPAPLPAEPITAPAPKRPESTCVCVQSSDLADAVLGDCFYWAPERIEADLLEAAFAERPESGRIYLRFPNMLTSDELQTLTAFAHAHQNELAGCMLTNMSQLVCKLPGELIADYTMNVWNSVSAETMRKCGIGRITASLEMTGTEIGAACISDPELVVYGRATLMTMRHCPVNAKNNLPHDKCRLCDAHKGACDTVLTDRKNVDFPMTRVRGSSGCYVSILNSAPLDLLGKLHRLPASACIRLIFTTEPPTLRSALASEAKSALAGKQGHMPQAGTTSGHYFHGVD